MIYLALHTEGLLFCCYVCLLTGAADSGTQSVLPLVTIAKKTFLLRSKALSSLAFQWPKVTTVLSAAYLSSTLTLTQMLAT